ncbi:MAG TPA: hypothetical protein VFH56_17010 [Acidimicrobiales bacterium]|nr:hypothetical protein [Acidimicrobiales bacterium]
MRVQSFGHVAFTTSLQLLDPDGNEVELYVDTSEDWRTDPLALA